MGIQQRLDFWTGVFRHAVEDGSEAAFQEGLRALRLLTVDDPKLGRALLAWLEASTPAPTAIPRAGGSPPLNEYGSRGVYAEHGAGRWGATVLVAVAADGRVVRRQELNEDATPEEEAARASRLLSYLDQVDPPAPSVDYASAVEAFLSGS